MSLLRPTLLSDLSTLSVLRFSHIVRTYILVCESVCVFACLPCVLVPKKKGSLTTVVLLVNDDDDDLFNCLMTGIGF